MSIRRTVSIAVLFSMLWAAGCAATAPETVIVKQTVISEKHVTVVVTQTPEATQEPTAPVTEVTVPRTETITLYSSAADRDYNIYVALPEAYSLRDVDYPVIYLLDGDRDFIWATEYSRWLSFINVIPRAIIVGIDNSLHRDQDLLPKNQEGVENFVTFLQEELIPYIDSNYRTIPTDRTLSGASHGGLFALYTLFHKPEMFNRYIVTSPPLFKDDLIFKYEEEFASNHSKLPVKLYLSIGGLEATTFITYLEELYERLEGRNYSGLDIYMVVIEDEKHMTTLIQGLIYGLRTVFP